MPKIKTAVFDAYNTFFTADIHIGHTFIQELRGYANKEEMHADLIAKWNDTVPPHGEVIILGDISFTNTSTTIEILTQLNGNLHLVLGNHDKKLANATLNIFKTVSEVKEIYIQDYESGRKTRVFMSHYSHQIWNNSHHGSYHLFGHSHNTIEGIGKSMDVGLDTHNYIPYTWEEIDKLLYPIPIHTIDHHKIRTK